MPTNNLSLTLGPGREEEEEETEEEETESTRTKCPAQGRESTKDGQSKGQRDEGVKKEREISTQRKTLSAPYHLEESHSTFFSGKQPFKVKSCREQKTCNSLKHMFVSVRGRTGVTQDQSVLRVFIRPTSSDVKVCVWNHGLGLRSGLVFGSGLVNCLVKIAIALKLEKNSG